MNEKVENRRDGSYHCTAQFYREDPVCLEIMSCKCNEIAWQNPSRPIPTNLLANLIEKIGTIASYLCKHQPLFFFEAGYVGIHRFLDVSSLIEA